MSSWFSSKEFQFGATALVSGAVVAGGILGYQHVRRQEMVEDLKSSIPALGKSHQADRNEILSKEDERSAELARRAQKGDYDDDLILEQLARNRVFLTDEGLNKLRGAFVIIVGCGGVGSHCTSALARSGVSRIRLIDFDQVTLSSLNRHAVATLADVGTPKVNCLRRHLQQITPWVKFDLRNELFAPAAADVLLGPWRNHDGSAEARQPDFIVDAIDNIDSKVALLAYCHEKGLKVISSMGAGCKSDPTRLFIGDISTSTEDPLSRSTRRRLRALGIASGIPVVYSTEKPGPGKASLLPLPEEEFQKGAVGELGVLPDFRSVVIRVTMYLRRVGRKWNRGEIGEGYDAGEDAQGLKLGLNVNDVGYLVEEVWRGRSVVSGVPTRLALVRWRKPADGSTIDRTVEGQKSSKVRMRDLVCMTREEAAVHEREVVRGGKSPEEIFDREIVEMVEARLEEEIGYEKYR
ncbi:tRNA threonylcarbamoyladenosine deHydratase [Hyphodiscus hymeniophilus]|uniref:tRNA threonylcarbamoyladenosine deHydratase n=1 Tax=Hyphodiscus hymeniophilus TaxID=353542 RepID=A0A9P6SMS0_9HELO|nr:tRNA threonylcarbamoyladenosine deHydratase [Hyphodiscus hymeniophilus]